jgi:outer membrane lipoprotein SlyB
MKPVVASLAIALAVLAASAESQTAPASSAERCDNCGVVVSIQVSAQEEQWTPLGAMTGGPTNLSNGQSIEQRSVFAFGKDTKPELVMIGAAGGAVYSKRPNAYQKRRWDVQVKMDDGKERVFQQRYESFLREGDRVRVMGTQLELL